MLDLEARIDSLVSESTEFKPGYEKFFIDTLYIFNRIETSVNVNNKYATWLGGVPGLLNNVKYRDDRPEGIMTAGDLKIKAFIKYIVNTKIKNEYAYLKRDFQKSSKIEAKLKALRMYYDKKSGFNSNQTVVGFMNQFFKT